MTKAKAVKTATKTLTVERLRSLLSYDATTGAVSWLVNRGPAIRGAVAGSRSEHGYIVICIDCQRYYAHRLAWLYNFGHWPSHQIDHKNGNGCDNRITNIRECTNAENCQNLGVRRSNTSGLTGVRWDQSRQRWAAQIRKNGKITPLGRFSTKEDAHQAYLTAKRDAHTFQPVPRGLDGRA